MTPMRLNERALMILAASSMAWEPYCLLLDLAYDLDTAIRTGRKTFG